MAAASVLAGTFLSIPKAGASTFPPSFTVGGNNSSSPRKTFLETTPPPSFTKVAATLGPWCLQTATQLPKCNVKGRQSYAGRKGGGVSKIPPSRVKGRKGPLTHLHVRPRPRPLPPRPPSHAPPPADSGSHGRPRFRCSQRCATPEATRHREPPTDLSDDSVTPPPFARRCPGGKGKPVPH